MIAHGEDVGQHLGRVPFVGQAVPDGHPGVLAQGFDIGVRRAAVLDSVVHAPQNPRGVLDRLLVTDLRPAGAQIGHMRSLVVGADFEGAHGARRSLLEDEGHVQAGEALALATGSLVLPQAGREVDQVEELLFGEVCLL